MKLFKIEEKQNAFVALFYLIWTILKEQWKIIFFLIIITLLFMPLPIILFSLNENFRMSTGLVSVFAAMPSILTLLVVLPMVFSQINTSSIKKRIKSVGISESIFRFSMMMLFTLVAIVLYYFMILVAMIIFSSHEFYDHGEWTMGSDPVSYIIYQIDSIWWMLIFVTPITMFGISTLGILISRWKLNDVIKGVSILFIILFILLTSRLILSPLDLSIYNEDVDGVAVISDSNIRFYNILRFLNPWGNMIFVNGIAMSGKVLTSYFDGYELIINSEGLGYMGDILFSMNYTVDILYSILSSVVIGLLVIFI